MVESEFLKTAREGYKLGKLYFIQVLVGWQEQDLVLLFV